MFVGLEVAAGVGRYRKATGARGYCYDLAWACLVHEAWQRWSGKGLLAPGMGEAGGEDD